MTDIVTSYPALRRIIEEEHKSRAAEQQKRQSEIDTVARLMAERASPGFYDKPIEDSYVYQYWGDDFAHMRCHGWWDDPLLYSAFMYLLWLAHEYAPPTWAQDMLKHGRALK